MGDDINIPRGYLQQNAKLNAETTCMLLKTDSWKASITAKDLAGLQLFQTSSKILDTIRVAVSKNPAAILAAMCELLQEKGKAAHYLRAAEYALAHRDVIDQPALSELNRLAAAAKADKANVELRELEITGRQRMTRTINHALYTFDGLCVESIVRANQADRLAAQANVLTEKNILHLIDAAQEANSTDCLIWLMNYKNEHFPSAVDDLEL